MIILMFSRDNQIWSFPGDVATIRIVAREIFLLNHHEEARRSLSHLDLEQSGVNIHEILYIVLNMTSG